MAAPFTEVNAVAAVLLRDNIDTDAIIPSREIRSVAKTGLAEGLFSNWRYLPAHGRTPDPQFTLNDPAFGGAQILLSGENFGCGSSREHAVWALIEYGFRAIIAPSFGAIFYRNCLRNGLLPARLNRRDLDTIAQWVSSDPQRNRPTVSLSARRVLAAGGSWPFEIDDDARDALLHGLSEIDQTMTMRERIAAFRAADRLARPWVYDLDRS
jgi:3-isopropylmalate/(R)-2-methylmalate dehydratase small subunit